MKQSLISLAFVLSSKLMFSQDLESGGSNSWILHTPDDGRTSLHIAPKTAGTWDWGKQTIFLNNGSTIYSGALDVGGNTVFPADASLHIKTSFGAFDRLTQIHPALPNKPALNLMASTDGSLNHNWWSWGVMNNGTWAFQPSTQFGGETGLFVNRNGDTGIGTTNPKTKFQLDGPSGTQNRLRINSPFVGAEARFDITMGTGDDDLGAGMRAYVPTGQPGYDRIYLGFYTTTYAGGLQSRIERVTIADNGNVGIGTTNPAYKLAIESTGQNVLTVKSSSHSIIDIESGAGLNSYLRFKNNGVNKWDLTGETTGNLRIYDYAAGLIRMVVAPTGNVGIGTTNPTQKLEVNGTIYSREVKVDLQAGTGPDYVFEPTYNLLTLAETEAYIKAHKHLPEVPSAKEMETNGINLSEMNMLLLKKVEELTLYVIEQDKKNVKLEKDNNELEARIFDLEKYLKK